ncbi:MAG: peptide ABC transporter substrate-binding protein [Verrucomicrobium sp.]|nr:peptide ABC transporter substrate-binding protein [Verrucomicrobium sp.]
MRIAAVILGAALLLAGCKGRETPVQRGDGDGVLLLGNGGEPSQLDPHLVTGQSDANIDFTLFEGLLTVDPQTLAPVPGVAERWEVTPDGLTYTFHLRHDARWSNGDPVTSADFLYSCRRILSPALGSEYAYMHFMVKNAEAYNAGKIADFSQVGYEAPDPYTFRVRLEHPVPYFPSLITHHTWIPVHRACIEKFGAMDERGTRWVLPGNMVGNGPFRLKAWKVNELVEVEKNPYYWDAARVRLRAVRFLPYDDGDAEERAFRSGQLHVSAVPVAKLDLYRKKYPQYLHAFPQMATTFLKVNVTKPPLDKPEVRRALAMAIDRESIVRTVLKGDQVPAFRLTPPDMAGYTGRAHFDESVAEARALMAKAGYPGGKGFPRLELLMPGAGAGGLLAEAIQQMWRKNLGIDVAIVNQEGKVYEEWLRNLKYQICFYGWIGDYVDPNTFLDIFVTNGGNNQTGWADPAYDKALAEANRTLDPAARRELLQKSEAILVSQMPMIPLFFSVGRTLWRPDVKGWYSNVLGAHPLKYVWLDPATAGPARIGH